MVCKAKTLVFILMHQDCVNRTDCVYIFTIRYDYLYVILHMNEMNGIQDSAQVIRFFGIHTKNVYACHSNRAADRKLVQQRIL